MRKPQHNQNRFFLALAVALILTASLWGQAMTQGANTFFAATPYATGQFVTSGGALFQCNTNHTSAATFALDVANWNAIGSLQPNISKAINQTAHGLTVGQWVYNTGTAYAAAVPGQDTVGVVTVVTDANNFTLVTSGYVTGLAGLTAGATHYLATTAGTITATAPVGVIRPVLIADTATSGWVQQYTNQAVASVFGEAFPPTAVVTPPTSGTSASATSYIPFVLPTPGIYEVQYQVRGTSALLGQTGTAGQGLISAAVYLTTGSVLVANSELLSTSLTQSGTGAISSSFQIQSTGSGTVRITTTAPNTSYFVGVWNNNSTNANTSSDFNGRSRVSWKMISGFQPVSGQMVDFINVLKTTTTTVSVTDVLFDSTIGGNIPYVPATGLFTLSANKTYELSAMLRQTATSAGADYQWVTAANVALTPTFGSATSTNTQSDGSISITYTPSVSTQVKLRLIAGTGTLGPNQQWATIKQIGSSATTGLQGATSTAAGVGGTVSAPPLGSQNQVLTGAGAFTSNIPLFVAGVSYTVGDVVVSSGSVYRCLVTHTAAGLIQADGIGSNWGPITTLELVNAQTGTSYLAVSTDSGKLLTFTNIGVVSVTLPQGTSTFQNFNADFLNLGVGNLVITPTTSTINGGQVSLTLTQGQSARIVSDGTNYQVFNRVVSSSLTGLIPTSNGGLGSSTAPTAGQIPVAQSATSYTPQTLSQDCTLSVAGVVTCLRTNNVLFGTFATQSFATPPAIGATTPAPGSFSVLTDTALTSAGVVTNTATGVLGTAVNLSPTLGGVGTSAAPTAGQMLIAQSALSYTPQTLSQDCTITNAGVVTCLKTNNVLFGTFATQNFATPPAIGGTTPNAGTFSSLSVTGKENQFVTTVTATSTLSATSNIVLVTTAGTTQTFPAATSIGQLITVKNASNGLLTLASTTFDSGTAIATTSIPMQSGESLAFVADGSNWQRRAGYPVPRPPNVVRFGTSGVYTPTVGMKYAIVEGIGGGGAGGSAGAVGITSVNACSGGAAGGYFKDLVTAAQVGVSQTVNIGAGGTTTGSTGNPGAATSFGALVSANGGNGGSNSPILGTSANGLPAYAVLVGGAGSTVTTGVDLGGTAGGIGFEARVHISASGVVGTAGKGGDSKLFNAGGPNASVASATLSQSVPGGNAIGNTGAGGGGCITSGGGAACVGGTGASGIVIITEYF